jgi:hypothetical protein
MTSMGPHMQGGSFIVIKNIPIRVLETPEQILSIARIVT